MDLPGHGGSDHVRLDFADTSTAVGEAAGRAVYIGYSLGGRLALRLALEQPSLIKALVLVGASPGIADARDRSARLAADEALAGDIESCGTRAFLNTWLAQPMFNGLTPTPIDMAGRLGNTPTGLAWALRSLGPGAQDPLWEYLGDLAMPVLLVAGGQDSKAILTCERMAGSIGGNAQVAVMPGTSHAPHLQQAKPFCQMVWRFLHPRPSRAKAANRSGSGTGIRNVNRPPVATSGSATTSGPRWLTPPRPHA